MKADAPRRPPRLNLQTFVPFRLNRLAAGFSAALASDYGERFGLDIPEWRVLATLGQSEPLSAAAIVRSTRTHKSRISRAVASLSERGFVRRHAVAADRRETLLEMTPAGRALFAALVPRMLTREADLLSALDPREQTVFAQCLTKLENRLGSDTD